MSANFSRSPPGTPPVPTIAAASCRLHECQHVVLLLRADLEDAADREALNARLQIDSGNRALARLAGDGHEHGDLVADACVERVGEARAEHDVALARLQIVEAAGIHVLADRRRLAARTAARCRESARRAGPRRARSCPAGRDRARRLRRRAAGGCARPASASRASAPAQRKSSHATRGSAAASASRVPGRS